MPDSLEQQHEGLTLQMKVDRAEINLKQLFEAYEAIGEEIQKASKHLKVLKAVQKRALEQKFDELGKQQAASIVSSATPKPALSLVENAPMRVVSLPVYRETWPLVRFYLADEKGDGGNDAA